jgi:hypothetical protein
MRLLLLSRFMLLSFLAALIAVQAPRPAPAQPTVPFTYLEGEPEQLVEAAFSAPFGRLLIAEFAAAIADSADAACLKANGIETPAIEGRARTIVVRHGAQFIRGYLSAVDRVAFKANLAKRMGAGAEAELTKLHNDPDVRAYLELAMPVRQAATALAVAETLGRNLLILKIKLSRRFDPIASGNQKLVDADPSNQVVDKLNALLANSKSAALTRYLKLTDAVQSALTESVNTNALLSMRTVDLMPGLESDLADLCIRRSK